MKKNVFILMLLIMIGIFSYYTFSNNKDNIEINAKKIIGYWEVIESTAVSEYGWIYEFTEDGHMNVYTRTTKQFLYTREYGILDNNTMLMRDTKQKNNWSDTSKYSFKDNKLIIKEGPLLGEKSKSISIKIDDISIPKK